MSAAAPLLDEQTALAAAEWYFLLGSGEASEAERHACQTWRQSDPRHELAWQRAQQIGRNFASLPAELALPSLNRNRRNARRAAVKALVLLLTAAPAGWLAWRSAPAREWLAEHRTATGEQRQLTLADGTRLHLNTATALDVEYDGQHRLIRLHAGEVLVETAPDGDAHRPFFVTTPDGSARALGTRFIVRRETEGSLVAVLQGAVEIRPARAPEQALVLAAGQQARFDRQATGTAETADAHADDWSRGILFVRNMRLADFLAELDRYRPGVLRCDPAVAGLTLSGAFQLGDIEQVLASLTESLPVTLRYRSRYWVTVEPA